MGAQAKVTGVILAGGLARRMGNQDKGLILCNGKPLVSYAIAVMGASAGQTLVNANRHLDEYRAFGLPVIKDQSDSFDGPLAGVLAAMAYAKSGVLLVMPCDSPLIEAQHLQKLLAARAQHDADVAVAFDGDRLHPVFLAIKVSLRDSLKAYLLSGQRKMETWLAQQSLVKVDFSADASIFANINSFSELSALGARPKALR